MKKNDITVITRDNFIHVLQLPDIQQKLKERSEIDHLYNALLEFLTSEGALTDTLQDQTQLRELAIRIPGTPVHVRLSGVLRDKLEDFVALYLILSGVAEGNWVKITASVVIGLANKVSILRKHLGERCVVESLGEVSPRDDKSICLNLFGKRCRYPQSHCQFMKQDNLICQFELEAVSITLESLEKRKILKKETNVKPFIWSIVF